MPKTFFKNLLESHGKAVTVEYQMDGETCASIVAKWPNTHEYRVLTEERRALTTNSFLGASDEAGERLCELDGHIADLEAGCLSDEEFCRIERWLSENHTHSSDIDF